MKVIQKIEIRREPRSVNLPSGPRTETVMWGTVEAPTEAELREKMKILKRLTNMVNWEIGEIE